MPEEIKVKCCSCGELVEKENTTETENGPMCAYCINRENIIEMLLIFGGVD